MKIIDAKELSLQVEKNIRKEIEQIGVRPCLVVIQANDDGASDLYVGNKKKACERVGIHSIHIKLGNSVTSDEILNMIDMFNMDKCISGILLQLPLYEHLRKDEQKLLQAITPEKDVDCFTYQNLGKMAYDEGHIRPLTAKGVVDLLKHNNVEICGKHVVVLGRSLIAGKSVSDLLLKENATVTTCHSKTLNLEKHTKDADILVCCMGQPKMIKAHHIKHGAVVINVGFSKDADNKTCGDIDFDDMVASEKPSIITKIFNSTGTMTVTNLLYSTLQCYKKQRGL